MRVLTEVHLALRPAREQRRDDVTDADRDARTTCEDGHKRTRIMIYRPVRTCRIAYRKRGKENLYPQDAELNWGEDSCRDRPAGGESGPHWWPVIAALAGVTAWAAAILGARCGLPTRTERVYAATAIYAAGVWLSAATALGPFLSPLPLLTARLSEQQVMINSNALYAPSPSRLRSLSVSLRQRGCPRRCSSMPRCATCADSSPRVLSVACANAWCADDQEIRLCRADSVDVIPLSPRPRARRAPAVAA